MPDEHLWTNIGGGLLGNHQISDKMLEVAVGECKVVQHTFDHGFGFKKNAGETVTMYHVNHLPDSQDASLQEEGEIPMRMLSFGKRSLTLTEHGEGLLFSEKLENLSKFKINPMMKKELTKNLAETMDNEATHDGFLSDDVKIVFTPTSLTGGQFSVTGTPGAIATAPLTKDHIKKLSAYMRDTIHVPFYPGPKNKGGGEYYMCLSCNLNIENLLLDSSIEKWQQHLGQGDMLYKGEMCMVHRVRFVEINRANAFSNVSGVSTVMGEAVLFGDEAVARIEAATPHLRMNPNWGGRMGTRQAMAWWGIYAFGPVWNYADDGKAKMIKLQSL
jgi:N4-gp56 family major capsid protein